MVLSEDEVHGSFSDGWLRASAVPLPELEPGRDRFEGVLKETTLACAWVNRVSTLSGGSDSPPGELFGDWASCVGTVKERRPMPG